MSRFKHSESEKDINKVLKMNQDVLKSIENDPDLISTRKSADKNIDSSMELLSSLGIGDDLANLTSNIKESNHEKKLEHKPIVEEWSEIVKEANDYSPETVDLEDILTESEIGQAFQELDEIYLKFSNKTSIFNKNDLSFLAVATALQVVKSLIFPYVAKKFDYGESIDKSKRFNHDDKDITKAERQANNEFRDKNIDKHGTGHWINMLYQSVPYDTTKGSGDVGINLGGGYHRMYTLGHDPILGWIFGTMNILTDTITLNNFLSFRVSRHNPLTGEKDLRITKEAVNMGSVLRESYDIVREDYLNLPAAVFAQAKHLKSDKYTKLGLPVPLLSSINEDFASRLYRSNYDALCFSRDLKITGLSFIVSKMIDLIIIIAHGLFRDEKESKELYDVRTRKILLIANSIASSSTIIKTAITKNPKELDLGSLLNTVIHLFTDARFIIKIKQEFIEGEISNRLQDEIYEINRLYDEI